MGQEIIPLFESCILFFGKPVLVFVYAGILY